MDTKPSDLKLCLICCSAFSTASTIPIDALNCRQHLISFCKLLSNSSPQPPEQLDQLLQSSFPGLDQFLDDSGMSVCPECHCTITVAMEMGTEAERKEQQVRKLQQEILEKMTELQTELDGFHDEMTKVEKCIENSDVSCLMYHMSQSPFKDENVTNGIMLIRNRITDVMVDLRNFKERQNQMLNPQDTKLFDLEQLYSEPQISIEEDEEYDNDDDYISYVPTDEPEMIRGTEGLLEAGEVAPMFFGHTIFGHEGDYRFDHIKKSKGDDEDFNEYDAEANKDSEDDEDDKESVHSIVSFDFPTPTHPTKQPTPPPFEAGTPPGPARGPPPTPPKKGTGVFRQEVIDHAIARERARLPEMDESPDPLKKYYLRYDPEVEKLFVGNQEVVVNEDTEVLECTQCKVMGKGLGGKKQHWRDMEKNMVAHCIGRHLGGFPCQWCEEKSSSYSSLKLHWKRSHGDKRRKGEPGTPGVGEMPYKCNMCEKCFSTPVGLKGHFLRRHSKSLEGKAKEIRPPKIKLKEMLGGSSSGGATSRKAGRSVPVNASEIKFGIPRKSPGRPHECHVCKFAFTKASHLKRHLDIHRKKGELV